MLLRVGPGQSFAKPHPLCSKLRPHRVHESVRGIRLRSGQRGRECGDGGVTGRLRKFEGGKVKRQPNIFVERLQVAQNRCALIWMPRLRLVTIPLRAEPPHLLAEDIE
eukprot:7042426-Prymnesium_polylepis.1